MQLTEEKLNELKALAKQATPGTWYKHGKGWEQKVVTGQLHCVEVGRYDAIEIASGARGNDLRYIAAAFPDVVLELVERIGRLEKEADWLAARMKCDNAFTPEQEADCIAQNGPCAQCLRKTAKQAVESE